jgi:phospholipase C
MLVCVAWDNTNCPPSSGRDVRSQSPIQHVFVLMLENRAFDHMLGFSEITGLDAVTGNPTSIDGVISKSLFNVNPSAPNVKVSPSIEADFKLYKPADDDPGHEFFDTLVSLCGLNATYNGGVYPQIDNSGFIAEYATMKTRNPSKLFVQNPDNIMKCYSPERLPVLNLLASEFVVCDRWFSSMPGPTWPNRFFMHAASSGGLDDSPSGLQSAGGTLFDGYRFENGTIFDRLDDSCIDWQIFAGDSFPVSLAISGMTLNELQGRIRDFDEFKEAVNDPDFSPSYIFIEPNYGNDLPPSAEDFTCGNSQHPLDDVTRGERLIKQVYETIRNSPHWNSSLLLITYDEHGGFYDHVPPPSAVAPGDSISDEDNNNHNFNFEQLGVRVPAVVISPLIPRGMIDHTVYDHTSLLATIEELFGLKPLTDRDAAANTLAHLLSLYSPRTDAPTALPEPAVSGFHCEDDSPQPQADKNLSTGTVPSKRSDRSLDQTPIDSEARADLIAPTLRGFLHVALLKSLAFTRGRDKPQIIKDYLAIKTRGEAKQFISNVAIKARALGVRRKARMRLKIHYLERR